MTGYNFIFSNRIFFRLIRHLAFWLAFSAWYCYMCAGYGDTLIGYLSFVSWLPGILPVCILSTYTTLYFLIPRFLLRREYQKFMVALVILSIFYPIVFDLTQLVFNPDRYRTEHAVLFDRIFDKQDWFIYKLSVWNGWGLTLAVSGFAAVIKLMKAYYLENSENERLQQQKNSHELQLLKSQLNSRFLFDALQSIQEHVRSQSPASSGLILKLSDLLSYILYENDETTVPLNKEIEIIEGYLNLEKEGHGNKLNIEVTQQGQIEEKRIIPLVLLPLVESCFEFSSTLQKRGAGVSLNFTVTGLVLLVTMKINNLRSFSQEVFHKSLRIKNVRHRLNSYYTGKHLLEITGEDMNYIVQLELSL